MMSRSLIAQLSLIASIVAMVFATAAMMFALLPESRAAARFAHPIDTIRVAYICLGHDKGERVGDIVCGIND